MDRVQGRHRGRGAATSRSRSDLDDLRDAVSDALAASPSRRSGARRSSSALEMLARIERNVAPTDVDARRRARA